MIVDVEHGLRIEGDAAELRDLAVDLINASDARATVTASMLTSEGVEQVVIVCRPDNTNTGLP